MSSQATLFLLTVVLGMFTGFIYDIFRILRKSIKHKSFIIQIEDVVYWIIVSFIMFYFMLNKNNGEIRFFTIIGLFLGMVIYFYTASIFVMKVSIAIINIVKKVIITIFNIVKIPINIAIKIIKVPLVILINIIKKFITPIKKVLQKLKPYVKIKIRKILRDLKVMFKKV